MSFRTTLALNVAPLCLRLALAGTFIWAGVSKVAYRTEVSDPGDIAQLVEWNIVPPQSAAVPAPQPDPQPDAPDTSVPEIEEPETQPETQPEIQPEIDPEAIPPVDDPETLDDAIDDLKDQIEDLAPAGDLPPEDPAASESDEGDEDAAEDDEEVSPVEDGSTALPVAFRAQTDMESVEVKRVMGLALMIHHAANPGVDDEGKALQPLWPSALANGTMPVVFAWVAAILELVCGAAMLIGFFTRLAALPLAGTMLTAMWLTQIGPAIQSGDAIFGFLPTGMFEMGPGGYVYTVILWQFALLMSALAMFLIGPGALSIDRLIFGGPSTRFDESGSKRQVEFVPMSDA